MAAVKAFAIASLPFVFVEAGTGIISLATGVLTIPPLIGIGTGVDLAILLAGMVVAVLRLRGEAPTSD